VALTGSPAQIAAVAKEYCYAKSGEGRMTWTIRRASICRARRRLRHLLHALRNRR
jgi:hypothetical protein